MPIDGRYRLLGEPEERRGTWFSTAQDLLLGSIAFLKLRPTGAGAAPLLDEARLLSDLQHPRLVQLLGPIHHAEVQGIPEPVSGFATAWIDAEPFTAAVAGLELSERLAVFGGLLDVVDYLHRRGLLHLDLKPQNVLGSRELGATLIDLGSAQPRDGGPGEAGGTLGYAAPEVLARQAASVMSDVYSLGSILYELLTGARPHGELEPRRLRQACLSGNVIPARAVRSDVPRALAALAQDMLHLSAARRPADVDEVRQRLREAGYGLPRPGQGSPPFVGREREAQTLEVMLSSRRAAPIALVGATGLGRSRLARRALYQLSGQEGTAFIDLSGADSLLLALHRLLTIDGPDLPPPGSSGWLEGASAQLRRPLGWRGLLFLGRLDALSPTDRGVVEALLPALAAAGLQVVVAADRVPEGAQVLPLSPLSLEELEHIGPFMGSPSGPELRRAAELSAGNPANLLRQLGAQAGQVTGLPEEISGAWETLATLPSGLSPFVQLTLPAALQRQIDALCLYGLAFKDGAELLQVVGLRTWCEVHPSLAPGVRALLRERWEALDPLWRALSAARLGDHALATEGLSAAVEVAGARRAELSELTERLAALGHRDAVVALGRARLADTDYPGVLKALDASGLTDEDADIAELRVCALLRAGRLSEAEERARAALARDEHPRVWLELGRVLMRGPALTEALEAVNRANALAPELARSEGLGAQILISEKLLRAGQPAPGLDEAIARVEALSADEGFPANALAVAGRLLFRRGEAVRGERLLERATRRADQEGDLRQSAISRLNRGNVLMAMGQGRSARQVYSEALLVARAADDGGLLLRLSYSLATLELSSGRLPAAETHLVELKALAQKAGDPEATDRVRVLEGQLFVARGQLAEAVATLRAIRLEKAPTDLRASAALILARALLEDGQPEAALETLATSPPQTVPASQRQARVIVGRAYLALGRRELAQARATAPEDPEPLDRIDLGELLYFTAGEDLDPQSFADRRQDLGRAAHLLKGERSAQAATLRDRLLEGPGAALEGIVRLTEAIHDPKAFPGALSRLVAEALGAHRVLIMLRMPGLGQQINYQELAGEEAAGIGREVMERVKGPDDVWQAADAFADPLLREASATVRTFEIRSLLAVAIPYRDRAIGALYVDDLVRPNRFGPDDIKVMRRLATAVGRIIALLPAAPRADVYLEPQDVLGVKLGSREQVVALEDSLELLHGDEQTNLLITGPTGAGKTWFARKVAEDVLGLEGLVELAVRQQDPQILVSALTGTQRGEFTGAISKDGVIQKAIAGRMALFIDEVQSLDEAGQQILLPLLELPNRRFGGLMSSTLRIDGPLHIILGTNVDVAGQRWKRHFRDDLWYRMRRVHVDLPPLAQRGPEAVYQYAREMLMELVPQPPERVFDISALQRVTTHEWPGNLRELNIFITQAAALYRRGGAPLNLNDLNRIGLGSQAGGRRDEGASGDPHYTDQLVRVERETLLKALRLSGWVQADAARRLGITRWTMHRALKRHELVDFVRLRKEQRQRIEPDDE